jgi:hypothetical protein
MYLNMHRDIVAENLGAVAHTSFLETLTQEKA